MYRVIKMFTDLQDNDFRYKAGDVFPRLGLKVSAERIEELSTNKNRRKIPLIEEMSEPVEAETEAETEAEVETETVEEKPKKKGRKRNENAGADS